MSAKSAVAAMRALLGVRTVLAAAIAVAFALTPSTAARAATIVVNSLADPGATGICALRDAINAANSGSATNGCAAGTGKDTIQFSVTGTISITSTLPEIKDSQLTIIGPASLRLTIEGSNSGNPVPVMQVESNATVNLQNLTISDGFSGTDPGGAILNHGTLTVTNGTFSGNETFSGETTFDGELDSGGPGGAIFNDGTLNVINSTFSGNGAEGSEFSGGVAFQIGGGAIYNHGTLTVTNSTFSDNGVASLSSDSKGGGAISSDATLTVRNSTFSGNFTFGGIDFFRAPGAAISNSGTLTIESSTFTGNTADHNAGGAISGGGTIINSTFSNNSATGGLCGCGFGGAIEGGGTIINSTFSGNSAVISGIASGTIINSTFSDNAIDGFGTPGVIVGGTITNSTISGNIIGGFGSTIGSAIGSGSIIKNTIVAGSTNLNGSPANNCAGSITDAGYNISDDNSCAFGAIGSLNSTNPGLSSDGLVNNGGPTQTIALSPGSPAIDAIPVADCTDQSSPPKPITTDQRGMPRPDYTELVCDIGAYESQETFAGQPGRANCHGKSVSALSNQFGSIKAAASALEFPSVKALQDAIRAYCGG